MKSDFLVPHLAVVLLSALALWLMRDEFAERARTRLDLALTPALAIVVAVVLLIVSPGKRFELWAAAIAGGLVIGVGAGFLLKVNQDFGRRVIRIARAWDGIGAVTLLLVLSVLRFVTSDLMDRPSGKFGVLGAAAAFLAVFLAARWVMVCFYKAPRAIHLDMARGENPRRTLSH